MTMSRAVLDAIAADPAFGATAAPYLVLDPDLRIHAANPAYTDATLTTAAELAGTYLFDAFPDNPADAEADGVVNLSGSLERVLRRGRRDYMGLQRYDVPDPRDRSRFVPKVWAPLNVPLRDADGRVAGILHHVEDVTDLDAALTDGDGTGWSPDQPRRLYEAVQLASRLRHAHGEAQRENRHLREALRTRGVIEQAKGVLIGQRGCGPDEAFAILVRLSQETNTKLYDVARALLDSVINGHQPTA
ncbi:ANTAR domain-containing protein [Amycolatopsis sp. NPDC021455]|uniref:ANTAR domain-containing protein n=1 Tax=Amycolatopsis sp. NPDC021455 TaxID=3154901 RepID=UPI0033E30A98